MGIKQMISLNKMRNKQKMKSPMYKVVLKTRLRNKMGIKQMISLKNIHTVQLEKASFRMNQGQGNMDKIPMPRFTLTVSKLMETKQTKVIEQSQNNCYITAKNT